MDYFLNKMQDTSLASRVKIIRKDKGFTQKDFGERLGVSRNAITNIEIERVEPSELFINHLCKEFNVNKEWMETGCGDPYIASIVSQNNNIADILAKITLDENSKLKSIIEKASQLDDEYLDVLEKLLIGLTK